MQMYIKISINLFYSNHFLPEQFPEDALSEPHFEVEPKAGQHSAHPLQHGVHTAKVDYQYLNSLISNQ